jgi:hypothetical protein
VGRSSTTGTSGSTSRHADEWCLRAGNDEAGLIFPARGPDSSHAVLSFAHALPRGLKNAPVLRSPAYALPAAPARAESGRNRRPTPPRRRARLEHR